MKGVCAFPGYHAAGDVFGFVEHFLAPVHPGSVAIADNTGNVTVDISELFADYSPDSGASASVGDEHGGVVSITTGNTDNNEAYLHTKKEILKFQAGKPFSVKARLQYSESNTDDANVFFGVIDAAGAANVLADGGGGMKTTASAAVFFKVDGGTNWKVMGSIGTTQTIVELTAANSLDGSAKTAGGSAYQVLEIEFKPYSSTNAWLVFTIDDIVVYRMDFVFTSATEMMVAAGVKAGGTTGGETLKIDYITLEGKP